MKINLVSDLFVNDYQGGAELTTESLFEDRKDLNVERIYSHNLTDELVKTKLKEKWIFGNYSKVSDLVLFYFAKNKLDYSVIEYDYKFCSHRSSTLHEISTKETCECHKTSHGKIVSLFLKNSKNCFWMSEKQLEIHQNKFPHILKGNNHILSSVFSKRNLNYIKELKKYTKKENNNYMILNSNSPVKNVNGCVNFAKKENLSYELVGNIPYFKFLRKLSSMKGLIFKPISEDTCPRLVIEASLLGCDVKYNSFVQHKDEDWTQSEQKILNYLQTRSDFFWEKVKI